ncbi:MAG: acetate--CoA ligase family protein [Clostridiales bacterium]|nr:acetate--CoA ligase family protein [Clostridiales bacterium]MCF8022978.1 acetate--CoA ligase family protein [Clostridiales bacterium]
MAGLESMFKPSAVAVVGASKKPGKIGYSIIRNLLDSGYQGKIYPINPKDKEIEGLTGYPSVSEVPDQVDLAIVSVPARAACDAAEDCGKAGVKNLVVVTAGFKEIGDEGKELENRLTSICSQYGMNMVGPNCVGVMDTHTPLNASFSGAYPNKGNIAFLSQSGAMSIAILDWSLSVGLGFSKMVSLGNKGSLSEIDFIEEAADDPDTNVIICYIEDITDGERFFKVAKEAVKKKPVVLVKSGVSQAGAQAASSHTGALAGSDLAYDTAFKQCGIIRANSMTELFDLAIAFSNSPLPEGDKVAIVTNSGGPGIITTDHVEGNGLTVARFEDKTSEDLKNNMPPEAGLNNPVDVMGDAKADRFDYALKSVSADPNVHSVINLMCPTAVTEFEKTSQALIDVKQKNPKIAYFAAMLGGESLGDAFNMLSNAGIPTYTFPEPAVNSIRGMVQYSKYKENLLNEEKEVPVQVNKDAVKDIFNNVKQDNRKVLLGSETSAVAEAYGIPAAKISLTTTADEAAAAGDKLGYPVVLKIASPDIMHKTDVGGVKVGLNSAEEVKQGYNEIMDNVKKALPDTPVSGVEVQSMMPKGTELIIGMTKDAQFGPMIAFGMGGIYVNLIKDVSFRLAMGINNKEIREMIQETKCYKLLKGYRGDPPADMEALVDTIYRVACLVRDFSEIKEMDVNPIFAYTDGVSALDVKISLE